MELLRRHGGLATARENAGGSGFGLCVVVVVREWSLVGLERAASFYVTRSVRRRDSSWQ